VLITNISPLTPNQQIRRHFSVHGPITSFEPQIDMENGGALGIIFIKYGSHEEAKKCVTKENGRRLGTGTGMGLAIAAGAQEGEEVSVVFDGEGKKLKAVLKELEDRKRREREEKKRKDKEGKMKEVNPNVLSVKGLSTPTPTPSDGRTPVQNGNWRPGQHPHQPPRYPAGHQQNLNGLPPHPGGAQKHPLPVKPAPMDTDIPPESRIRKPPLALTRARAMTSKNNSGPSIRFTLPSSHSESSTPNHIRGRPSSRTHFQDSPAGTSRSPSPISRKPGQASKNARQKEHEIVVGELAKNGMDHVRIDGGAQLGGAVREEDVKQFFDGFKVDKVSALFLVCFLCAEPLDNRFCETILVGMLLSTPSIRLVVRQWF
jgi:RNA recognition motif-containing protein